MLYLVEHMSFAATRQRESKILQMHGLPCTHTKSEPSKVMLKKPYIVNQSNAELASYDLRQSFAATGQRESKTRCTLPAVSLYVGHLVSAIAW